MKLSLLGLDTSHSVAFVELIHERFPEIEICGGWPGGSLDIPSSRERVSDFTYEITRRGIPISETPEAVIAEADGVLILNLDGGTHRELFERVARPGLRVFIDKPIANEVQDAEAIFALACERGVSVFSASALRFVSSLKPLLSGLVGELELTLTAFLNEQEGVPRYHFYGIHAVELLVQALGPDWTDTKRLDADGWVYQVTWSAGHQVRIEFGNEPRPFGLEVRAGSEIRQCRDLLGQDKPIYGSLVHEIMRFMEGGILPVKPESTLSALRLLESFGIGD